MLTSENKQNGHQEEAEQTHTVDLACKLQVQDESTVGTSTNHPVCLCGQT